MPHNDNGKGHGEAAPLESAPLAAWYTAKDSVRTAVQRAFTFQIS